MAKKGKKAPDWYYDVPELLPTEHFMMEAFWSLSTSRNNGMSTGPIPWDSVQRYAEIHNLGFEQAKVLHRCIRALDNEFLKHLEKEREREAKVRDSNNG